MSRLPDFMIIGAMKAATSSLHDQLAALDGVFMSTPKELYFFSDDPVFARGLGWYSAHFDDAEADDLCGESTTHYTKLPTHPRTVERIRAAVPEARFIYVMRHPIDRLISQYTHMWLERETTADFSAAVDGAVPEMVDYSRYAMQLRPYFETFGAERVLPVFVSALRADPDGALQSVVDHIGLDRVVSWNHDLGANNVSAERLRTSRWRDGFKTIPGYEAARQLIPESAIDRLRQRWRPTERPELTDRQTEQLTAIFDADLAELGGWLGIDLSTATFDRVTSGPELSWSEATRAEFPVPVSHP